MGRIQKPTPLKHCAHCASKLERKRFPSGDLECLLHFSRRKYCDQQCMARAFESKPKVGKAWATTHFHARKMVPKGSCERCGKPNARDVHHLDGDHTNNERL